MRASDIEVKKYGLILTRIEFMEKQQYIK